MKQKTFALAFLLACFAFIIVLSLVEGCAGPNAAASDQAMSDKLNAIYAWTTQPGTQATASTIPWAGLAVSIVGAIAAAGSAVFAKMAHGQASTAASNSQPIADAVAQAGAAAAGGNIPPPVTSIPAAVVPVPPKPPGT